MENKAKTGAELLAALMDARAALREMLETEVERRGGELMFDSPSRAIWCLVEYAFFTDGLSGPERMAKLAEAVEQFMKDNVAYGAAQDSMPLATKTLQ